MNQQTEGMSMAGVSRVRRAVVGLTLVAGLTLAGCAAERTLPPEEPVPSSPQPTTPEPGSTDHQPGDPPPATTPGGTEAPGGSPTPPDDSGPSDPSDPATTTTPEPSTADPGVTPSPDPTSAEPTTSPSPEPSDPPTDPGVTPEPTPPTLLRPPPGYTRTAGAVTEDGWEEVLVGQCTYLTRASAGGEPVNPREAGDARDLSATTLTGHQAADGATGATAAADLALYNGPSSETAEEDRTNLLMSGWTNTDGAEVRGAARTEVMLDHWGTAYLDTTELRFVCPDGAFDETGWAALWPQVRVANPAQELPGEWTEGVAGD
ncbi:hypothetical protein EXU48_03275 [Occultella glacieicola]|uniref:Uncharacterized protein n=1 Tax=Occultella glacieicola TaxID=2518684 RepID=A0ABY2E8Z3_9MICO|nr:hypothetical protein [Occultella glacieicola]TDE97245.1 hypothetical protein EXU48_03275 [Occultella glacieicola]